MGLWNSECGVGSRTCSAHGPCTPNITACSMPTLAPHQTTRTAQLSWTHNMFLNPLGVVSHLHFTALELDVPCLSCSPPKLGDVPVSFQATTLPRLLCSNPAQFPRFPHHQGCNVKSYGTLLHFCRVFRPIRQRLRGHPHAKVGGHGRSGEIQS